MILTTGDLFSGAGGWSLGAMVAGCTPLFAIDAWQVAVDSYNRNIPGEHAICARVEDVDPATLSVPDIILASPPCQEYSTARDKSLPAHPEADAGYSVIPYLETLLPRAFLLENVPPYIRSEPFRAIVSCLHRLGYVVDWSIVNSADYGVPQTRRRLILRAMRGSLLPPYPAKQPWVGWYEAIEDLIPTLPPSAFADWQKARLATMPAYSFLLMTGNTNIAQPTGTGILAGGTPANTVTPGSTTARACLVSGGGRDNRNDIPGVVIRDGEAPCFTVTGNASRARAFVAHPTADNDRFVVSPDDEPMFTCKTSGIPRAYLLEGGNAGRDLYPLESSSPARTILNTHKSGYPRAYVVEGQSGSNGTHLNVLDDESPMHTVAASALHRPGLPALACGGRVVRLTLPCLARFQTFPDSYVFPAKKEDAAKLIGNAIPSLLARLLIEPIVAILLQEQEMVG